MVCKKISFYKCPRCKENYCTVDCYKKHSVNCTEDFYKENVEQVLKGTKFNDKEKTRKIKELVKDYNEEANEMDEEILRKETQSNKQDYLSYEKLALKLVDGSFSPEVDMSKNDWDNFYNFVYSNEDLFGELNMKNWYPFWEIVDENRLKPCLEISDLSADSSEIASKWGDKNLNELIYYADNRNSKEENNNKANEDSEEKTNIPKEDSAIYQKIEEWQKMLFNSETDQDKSIKELMISRENYIKVVNYQYTKLPFIKSLTKVTPNIKVLYSILSVCGSTVYVHLMYMGDILSNIEEVVGLYSVLNPALFEKTVYSDFDCMCSDLTVKLSLFEKAVDFKSLSSKIKVIAETLISIFSNKFYMVDCLLRIFDLVHNYEVLLLNEYNNNNIELKKKKENKEIGIKEYQSKESETNQALKNHCQNISGIKQKIIFYLSYIKSLNFDGEEYKKVKEEMLSWKGLTEDNA